MLNSAAWKTMKPDAKALLIAVWQRHNGTNNGTISYATREAADIGLSNSAAARAFRELIERGFLRVAKESRFSQTKMAREWTITAEKVGDERPTNDFMRWTIPSATSGTLSATSGTESPKRAIKLPPLVPPVGLKTPSQEASQCHQWDTSIIAMPGASQRGARAAERSNASGVQRPELGPRTIGNVLDSVAKKKALPSSSLIREQRPRQRGEDKALPSSSLIREHRNSAK
jgi:hypothetical protein